jgi:cyclopropane fatty-acyl-phospholipid synthase-like methyltransferase
MRLLKSHFLNDGKLFNDGRPVDVIQIERDADFDILFDNIIQSGYYDRSYFDSHIHYQEGEIKFDSFHLASILSSFHPTALLELGCGRGDILFLLNMNDKIKVRGIEFSQDVLSQVWPSIREKIKGGDVLEICKKEKGEGMSYDTFCAFDLWEHIHPQRLHEYIAAVVTLAEEDSLFLFNLPAIGEDRVFGEIFPLELEENRDKFNQRLPFDYLNAETLEPAIPANGHLIWAHTEWWEKQFEIHGLIRAEVLEKSIHEAFDEHLFYARKSFYLFHLDSSRARKRVRKLVEKKLNLHRKWKLLVNQQKLMCPFIDTLGGRKPFIDLDELKLTIHHAEYYMTLDLKRRMGRRIGTYGAEGGKGLLAHWYSALMNKVITKGLDAYVKASKHRHYLAG